LGEKLLSRHLLVVEDQSEIRELVKMVLEGDGTCRVSAAGSVEEARSLLARDPPHAAIIDAVLPRGSGLALALDVADHGIPVLIITGDPKTRAALTKAGCPHLAKPFHLTEFMGETRALLDDATRRCATLVRVLSELLPSARC
jgi:DNA-binding response OmpR family regulator